MKNLVSSILITAFLFLTTIAAAETLSLNDCLEKADRNNPALKSAQWDTRIAEENVRLSKATMFPRIDAQTGYTIQQKPQGAIIRGQTAETQQADYATAGVSAYYTLYDFGRRNARQQQTRSAADSTMNMVKAKHKDVALQVIESYFSILESSKLISSARQEVSQIEQHRRMAQAMFQEGVVTRNDVLQADVRLASARQKLISITNRRDNNWLQLNYLTGASESYRADLDENTKMTMDEHGSVADDTILGQRHEILALRQGVEASEAEVRETKSNYLPELYSRLAMDYVQNDKAKEQTIMSATIGLKLNIFDGFATSATRDRAIRSRSRSMDILRQTEAQIRLELATSKNDVSVSRERISVTETAVKQSEENLRINMERYRERVGTATEVLDAQTLVTQSKTDYYNALYDHQVSMARLKRAMGLL